MGSVTVDIYLVFAAYFISVVSLGVSVYAMWTLVEIKELYKQNNSKANNTWDHYQNTKQKKNKETPWAK
jgi:hypothetical protein